MRRLGRGLLALVLAAAAVAPAAAQPDEVAALLGQVETALGTGDRAAFLALTAPPADGGGIGGFVDRWFSETTTRAAVHERDRVERDGPDRLRLTVDTLVEADRQGRLATWRLDVDRGPQGWRIVAATTQSVVEGLFRLALDETVQYRAKDLVVSAEDLELRLDDGEVFVATVPAGITVAVLLGRGEMIFSPAPVAEQRQIALLTGEPRLRQRFDGAVIRLNPADQARRLPAGALTPVAVDRRRLERARQLFAEEVPKSFSVDLADLSRETWSLVPSQGDLVAEVRTRKYGTLTYAHDGSDQEDISLFDRQRRRNLSIYASASRLASRGRAYDEDDDAEIDVLDYSVDTTFFPDRFWMEGRTRLRVRVRAFALSAVTIRLSDRLVVRSVVSQEHGRLLYIRVRNQNSLVVNLPDAASRGDEFNLTVVYAGRHEPQGMDRENIEVAPQVQTTELAFAQPEPHYLYSNRSYWYAQPQQSDYATATVRFTVPTPFGVVCSGVPASGSPVHVEAQDGQRRSIFVFTATAPLRYLSCVVSRFGAEDQREVTVGGTTVPLRMRSTARQRSQGRELLSRSADIMAFYGTLVGEVPYPDLSVAVIESQIPGGHAPGHMAIINQPLATSPFVWRDDPASFHHFPDFFLAHELAHQWWGQAVGWENYHEQWLSEGFAQYFAALYAEHRRGPGAFADIMRQMARWSINESDQGPVYLGYRLGHLRGEGRVFRALVYNKAGAVLHMLRRMLGDEAFFRGVRAFYDASRFQKAGTEDVRRAFEDASSLPLEAFFEQWIFGQDVPVVTLKWQVIDQGRRVRVELRQPADSVFVFPATLERQYRDGTTETETVTIGEPVTMLERDLKGPLRRIELNDDRLTPVVVKR